MSKVLKTPDWTEKEIVMMKKYDKAVKEGRMTWTKVKSGMIIINKQSIFILLGVLCVLVFISAYLILDLEYKKLELEYSKVKIESNKFQIKMVTVCEISNFTKSYTTTDKQYKVYDKECNDVIVRGTTIIIIINYILCYTHIILFFLFQYSFI